MDEDPVQPLDVVIQELTDQELRLLVKLALSEQIRRFQKVSRKARNRTKQGLPNAIFKELK